VTVLGGDCVGSANCVGSGSSRLVHFIFFVELPIVYSWSVLFVLSSPTHLELTVMRVVVGVSNIR